MLPFFSTNTKCSNFLNLSPKLDFVFFKAKKYQNSRKSWDQAQICSNLIEFWSIKRGLENLWVSKNTTASAAHEDFLPQNHKSYLLIHDLSRPVCSVMWAPSLIKVKECNVDYCLDKSPIWGSHLLYTVYLFKNCIGQINQRNAVYALENTPSFQDRARKKIPYENWEGFHYDVERKLVLL